MYRFYPILCGRNGNVAAREAATRGRGKFVEREEEDEENEEGMRGMKEVQN